MTILRSSFVGGALLLASAVFAYDLTGTVRDFKRGDVAGGHPDFQTSITGLVTGMVDSTLNGAGNPVYVGAGFYGGVTSAATFDQWYNDVAGVNMSQSHTISLSESGGVWTFSDGDFFPIDGVLFGNEGLPRNYHFTYEIAATFTYTAADNLFFEFVGDDDVWVFFNNKLAVDLGGVHGAVGGSVDLNASAASLGLVDGNTYSMKFFFAERHTSASTFAIETNLNLTTVPEPATFAALGIGVAIASRRRLRR